MQFSIYILIAENSLAEDRAISPSELPRAQRSYWAGMHTNIAIPIPHDTQQWYDCGLRCGFIGRVLMWGIQKVAGEVYGMSDIILYSGIPAASFG